MAKQCGWYGVVPFVPIPFLHALMVAEYVGDAGLLFHLGDLFKKLLYDVCMLPLKAAI